MGEDEKNIYITGSPDLDLMVSKFPTIGQVKQRYNIKFKEYAIGILHPNPANLENIYKETEIFCNSIVKVKKIMYLFIQIMIQVMKLFLNFI